jgi:hypothetical protein
MPLSTSIPRRRRYFRQSSISRLAIALLTLLAFTSQTILTQTHIHAATRTGTTVHALTVKASSNQTQLPQRSPSDRDPANCPICQVMAHSGSYVTPSFAALVTISVGIYVAVFAVEVVTFARLASHGWLSRAPPRP